MKAARLVVLGIAVAAGGLAAILAGGYESAPPPPPAPQIATVDVLVAKSDLDIGTKLTGQEIEWQSWPETAVNPTLIRKNERPDAIEKLTGGIVRVPIAAGEPVRDNKVIRGNGSGYMAAVLPTGMRAYSTEISPETGAGGFILPNDRVDVIVSLTRSDRRSDMELGSDSLRTETILTDVRVLAIDQLVQEKDGQRVVIGKTATLEVTQRQAEILAEARQNGVLSLTLRSMVDARSSDNADADADRRRNGARINTIRFGVSAPVLSR